MYKWQLYWERSQSNSNFYIFNNKTPLRVTLKKQVKDLKDKELKCWRNKLEKKSEDAKRFPMLMGQQD